MASATIREASHAGSWYSAQGATLNAQLDEWMAAAAAEQPCEPNVRALIGPHAGFSYSGATLGFAYHQMMGSIDSIERIFVLGPSHHVYLDNCALPTVELCETPLGNLRIDTAMVAELNKTGAFARMSKEVDEDEHSIEMHLPYLAKVIGNRDIPIVTVMVGALSAANEARFGEIFTPYLQDERNFFVISSDFCHWGARFRYQPVVPGYENQLYKGIEALDREAMTLIEAQDTAGFQAYLERTKNTICGRHAITLVMHALAAVTQGHKAVNFVHYSQSSAVKSKRESSVSYASAVWRLY